MSSVLRYNPFDSKLIPDIANKTTFASGYYRILEYAAYPSDTVPPTFQGIPAPYQAVPGYESLPPAYAPHPYLVPDTSVPILGVFKVTRPGIYNISADILWEPNQNGLRQMQIAHSTGNELDPDEYIRYGSSDKKVQALSLSDTTVLSTSLSVKLDIGQRIVVLVRQTSGGDLNVVGNVDFTNPEGASDMTVTSIHTS